MASIDKIKGRFLFGVDAPTSVPNLAGAGSLALSTGAGGVTWYPNYVDLGQNSFFTTPFTSTSRNRTVIVAGMMGFWNQVNDSGTNKWPTVTQPNSPMASANSIVSWQGVGGISFFGTVASVAGGGGTVYLSSANTVDRFPVPISYRDATFTVAPTLFIASEGDSPTGTKNAYTVGRILTWLPYNVAPYAGFAQLPLNTVVGNAQAGGTSGTQANSHVLLMGYAEYSYLSKAESLEAATEMVNLLEARGWTGVFHNPVTAIPSADDGIPGQGEGPYVPVPQPAITATGANFTVTASPVSGWTRITKVGGTNGTQEEAAITTTLNSVWTILYTDPSGTATYSVGASKTAGPFGAAGITGWNRASAANGTIGAYAGGAYAGKYHSRVPGETIGVSRGTGGSNGNVGGFFGADRTVVQAYFQYSGSGLTDAAVPMIFDCTLGNIGAYIDVKVF